MSMKTHELSNQQPRYIFEKKGLVHDELINILIDSGATDHFMNENNAVYQTCLKNHVKTQRVQVSAKMADNSSRELNVKLLKVPITIIIDDNNVIKTELDFYVSPMNNIDMILGRDFINEFMNIEFKGDKLIKLSNPQNELVDDKKTIELRFIRDEDDYKRHSGLLEPEVESDDEEDEFAPLSSKGIEEVKVGTGDGLNKSRRVELGKQIINEFVELFPKELPAGLPPERPFDMSIKFINENITPLIKKRNVIYSIRETQLLRDDLQKFNDKQWTKISQSPIASPAFYVDKKNTEEKRFCIDYRGINLNTVKQDHSLPHTKEIIQIIRNAKIWSTLDLKSGYYQIRIKPEDSWKTSFNCHFGQFEWKVIPFGLANAPAVFQQTMNWVLQPVLGHCCVVYIDDIVVYSDNIDDHYKHLSKVLSLLKQHQFYLNNRKCNLFSTNIQLLGFEIDSNGMKMQQDKLNVIRDYPPLKSVSDVRSFIGTITFYKCFCPNFSHIIYPLTEATKSTKLVNGKMIETKPFVCTKEMQQAIDEIKYWLLKAPTLHHVDYSKDFILETDASNFAIGAVLSQQSSMHSRHPIEYYGKKLLPAEKNYATYEKELLAIVKSLEYFRHIIDGQKVNIYTDHKALIHFMTMKEMKNQRQARWSLILSKYNITFNHISGKDNKMADFISRRPDWQDLYSSDLIKFEDRSKLVDNPIVNNQIELFTKQVHVELGSIIKQVKQAQRNDDLCQTIKNDLHHETNQSLKLHLENDMLYHGEQIYVPSLQLRSQIITEAHEGNANSGHAGIAKTLEIITEFYWWQGIRQSIIDFIGSCETCQKSKPNIGKEYGLLNPIAANDEPWSDISIDFIGPLPMTSNGLDSIIVIVDRTTRYGIFIANKTTDRAVDVLKALNRFVFSYFGLPLNITSDRDTRFNSEFYRSFAKYWNIKLSMTTSFHPKGDGLVERLNQTLINYLTSYVNENRNDWNNLLSNAMVAYNSKVHTSTGFSPHYLVYGYRMRNPFRIKSIIKPTNVKPLDEHLKLQQQAHEQALNKLNQANDKMKAQYDQHRRKVNYKIGDLVYLDIENLRSVGNRKFMNKFIGPFPIIDIVKEGSAVRIKLPFKYKEIHDVINVERLKPAREIDSDKFPTQSHNKRPDPVLVEGQVEYEIEKLVDRDGDYYKVRWKGYDETEDQWFHKTKLPHAQQLINDYETMNQQIKLQRSAIKEKSYKSAKTLSERVSISVRCTGTNCKGLRCKRQTRRGLHCWYHAMKQFNYRIKQSNIKGLGLFSGEKGYKKGDIITTYTGTTHQYDATHQGGEYAIEINSKCYIDGCESTSIGSYANDCRRTNKRSGICDGNNAEYIYDRRNKLIKLRAKKDILPHSEIFCNYGQEYWRESKLYNKRKLQFIQLDDVE